MKRFLPLLLAAVAVAGCGAKRPVLYPNEALERTGRAAAERDIDECMASAKEYAAGASAAGRTAGSTVVGGAAGAAIGAAGGAVAGNVGRGAGVGAATGATAGLLRGLFTASEPDPIERSYVERCLREKGLDPIGWK